MTTGRDSTVERRQHQRAPFPAEAVIAWHHNPGQVLRFQVVEVSDGGMRIRTSVPLPAGLTGITLRLLPDGTELNRSVMVVWCQPTADETHPDDGPARCYEVGMRWF